MPSYFGKPFDSDLRKLKSSLPIRLPLKVRTYNEEDWNRITDDLDVGDCWAFALALTEDDEVKSLLIGLTREQDLESARDCLIHEYAHCLDYVKDGFPKVEHRNSWGEMYAKCYRVVHEEDS